MTDLDLSKTTLGEFVLREQIGAGGYGTVYRAEQPKLRRQVVVKVLRQTNAALERFEREAQVASRLDHPYAVHMYSFGIEDDGLRWIAMEFVQGSTLAEWIKTYGPMPFARFVPFFERVTEVVHAAHERGIVHRDLKPSNIMVLELGGQLFPKLLDFGIARLLDDPVPFDDKDPEDNGHPVDAVTTVRLRAAPPPVRTCTDLERVAVGLTHRGVVLGSVPYMSPEQWQDPGTVGPATDIYSLGCVAYEALTGRMLFTAEDRRGYYELHRRAEPPPLGDGIPPNVDKAIRRALAKSPDARHADALGLASELRAVLRAEPREQLRVSAQQWNDRARSPDLLWGGATPSPASSAPFHRTRSASWNARSLRRVGGGRAGWHGRAVRSSRPRRRVRWPRFSAGSTSPNSRPGSKARLRLTSSNPSSSGVGRRCFTANPKRSATWPRRIGATRRRRRRSCWRARCSPD